MKIRNIKLYKRGNWKPSFFDGVIGRSWKIPIIIIFAMIAWVFFITALYFLLELIVASGIVLEIFA